MNSTSYLEWTKNREEKKVRVAKIEGLTKKHKVLFSESKVPLKKSKQEEELLVVVRDEEQENQLPVDMEQGVKHWTTVDRFARLR